MQALHSTSFNIIPHYSFGFRTEKTYFANAPVHLTSYYITNSSATFTDTCIIILCTQQPIYLRYSIAGVILSDIYYLRIINQQRSQEVGTGNWSNRP